jgi:hypothetical protein
MFGGPCLPDLRSYLVMTPVCVGAALFLCGFVPPFLTCFMLIVV